MTKPADVQRSREVIAIFGPTGVGKTQIAIALADTLRERGQTPVAVSADAIQVYQGLDVLSGKATADEQARLEHRLLSYVPLTQEYSAGAYAEMAHTEIDVLASSGCRPLVGGGTGLYLRAALTDLDLRPAPDPSLRSQIEAELAAVGPEALHRQLSTTTATAVHPNDRKRIVRALELERMGERPHTASDELWSRELRRPARLFGIVVGRDELAERVSRRVERMLGGGAIEEVESALDLGISRTARKALGFKEIAAHLAGELDRSELSDLVKRRHLAYAKRQLTWMRKLAEIEFVDRTGIADTEAAAQIAESLS